MSELTEEQKQEIRFCFSLFDKNGDGQVSKDEIIEVMRAMKQDPTEGEVKDMIAEVDLNSNGCIEYSEFEMLMAKQGVKSVEQQENDLLEAFKVFDRNGDGYITIDELRVTMANMGEPLTEAELEDMMTKADTNNDGKVRYHEFVKVMCS